VFFYWCKWCRELSAVVGEDELGRRDAGTFGYDQKTARFVLRMAFGAPKDIERALAALSQITFEPPRPC
jgi:hypothetical protein